MGKQDHETTGNTIANYISSQFSRHAKYTSIVLLIISSIVFVASVKFSTDRYVRALCDDVGHSARILVETSQLDTYKDYYADVTDKLKKQLYLSSINVVQEIPKESLNHYSLGHCSIHWRKDFKAAFFTPTYWAGKTLYVQAVMTPKFVRTDLMMFIIAVCLVLFVSYFFGTRSLLRNIHGKITDPIHDIWKGLKTGSKPSNLEIKEISELWTSLVEYKELLLLRNRMHLAKEYIHEIKSPVFFQYNQLKRLSILEDHSQQKKFIADTILKADELITQMEKALKKIATDDYAKHPKPIDLASLVTQKDSKFQLVSSIFISGDKTLIKALLQNAYNNAIDACGSIKQVETSLRSEASKVILSIKNPVPNESNVDTNMVFVSGYTTKTVGTGLGLSISKNIVEIHGGRIEAFFSKESRIFELVIHFPESKGVLDANT